MAGTILAPMSRTVELLLGLMLLVIGLLVLASEPLGATTVAAAFGLEIALSAGGELLATA